ncbi:hypothetical protein V5799_030087 [Amblyomma americanum]|uniref:Uncharacterized protein n=1 Tax=Amblyomma americanum TaxID=6943 RepID=A0AAQ4EPT3_AMBAM
MNGEKGGGRGVFSSFSLSVSELQGLQRNGSCTAASTSSHPLSKGKEHYSRSFSVSGLLCRRNLRHRSAPDSCVSLVPGAVINHLPPAFRPGWRLICVVSGAGTCHPSRQKWCPGSAGAHVLR